jgi:Sec-independent protein translocase protein TatA
MGEITVILVLALIFLGPTKLPELASGLGKLIREIRKTTADVKNEIQLDEHIRKPFDELRDAMTLHPDELKRRDGIAKELEEARRRLEAEVKAIGDSIGDAVSSDSATAAATADHVSGAVPSTTATGESVANVPAGPAGTVPRHETPAYVNPGAPVAPLGGSKSGPISSSISGTITGPGSPKTSVDLLRTTLKGSGDASRPRSATPPPPTTPFATKQRVAPPVSSVDKTNTTQYLSEEDLLPSDAAASPPPAPPASTRSTGTHKIPPPTPGKPPGEKKT